MALVLALTAALLTAPSLVLAPSAAAAVTTAIAVDKQGPGGVLAGNPAAFTLTATNPSTAPGAVTLYNLSLRDVLAPGVAYVAGSTTPADLGDPRVVTAQVEFPAGSGLLVPQQTLIWENVADLQLDAEYTLGYSAVADGAQYPVGASFANTAQPFGSTNPRLVPRFDALGAPIDAPTVGAGPADTVTTTVDAVEIVKSDNLSAEGALLRGVHDNVATYRLQITNNDLAATTGVTVVDLLPAGLEFLGCGPTDHSTTGPEYPGAGPLSPQTCSPAPTSVSTVTLDGSVFTRVAWTLPDLAPGQQAVVTYPAGIPLRANTATWPGAAPSPGSLEQGANLDNNTGAPTRQEGAGLSLPNTATVVGTYSGQVVAGGSTTATDTTTHTVTAKDVRVQKNSSTGRFRIGEVATFTLDVQTSEYASADAVVLTDTLSNGLCPLMSVAQWAALVAADPALGTLTGCVAEAGQEASLPFESVTYDRATGTFGVVFTPIPAIAADTTTTVTYGVRMLDRYPGGALSGSETSAGDTFGNSVDLTATTTPVAGTGETGPATVTDGSQAELTTDTPGISKTLKPQQVPLTQSYSCDGTGYVDPTDPVLPAAASLFAPGDTICFELVVGFADGVRTRNPIVTDFLPAGTSYVAGSAVLAPANTLPAAQVQFDDSGAADGLLSWTLGAAAGTARQVEPDQVFAVRFAATVVDPAAAASVDVVGNLMKLRAENSSGKAIGLRDDVSFALAPAVPMGLAKTVLRVNGSTPADAEAAQVKQGDVVDFRVAVTHGGRADLGTDRPISDIAVWDVLPAPFTCADVVPAAGLECRDPDGFATAPAWNPTVTTGSILRWTVDGPLAVGATTVVEYRVTVPQIGPQIGTPARAALTNTASVSSYTVPSNTSDPGWTYYPQDNIDGSVPPAQQLTPPVGDTAGLVTATATATKVVTSAISTGSGNNGLGQATIGEVLTYDLTARVPAGLTVSNGVLTDLLPTGFELLNATNPPTTTFLPDATSAATAPLPAGFTVTAPTASPGTGTALQFPTVWTNSTATDQLFRLTVTGRFTTLAGNTHNTDRVDTARFTFATTGGTAITVDATATSTVVEPNPSVSKTVSPAGPYTANQQVTYQLAVGNAAGRPTAYDTWVTDCLPAGLTFGTVVGSPPGTATTTPGTGAAGNGCAVGATLIAWHRGDVVQGTTGSLQYTAVISPSSAAGAQYQNTARLSALSVPADRSGPAVAVPGSREYTRNSSRTITVNVPQMAKTVTPTAANVGQQVTYTVTATVPVGVNLYSAVLRDTLPAGIDPASVSTVSVSCTRAGGSTCAPIGTGMGVSGTQVTWTLGTLAAEAVTRTVTVVYTARVADVAAAAAGAQLRNSAGMQWAQTPGGAVPAGTTGTPATAVLTVQAPVVRVTKSVTDRTPEPGEVFTYTVTATNGGQAGDANVGPAYDVAVSDVVPDGVVVQPASLPPGVTLTGTAPDGSGGTLSWVLPGPIAAGGSEIRGYQARLAASGDLTGVGLTNTARVTGVWSQPGGTGRSTVPTGTATATVTPDLPRVVPSKVAVTASPTSVGEPFTWRITLTNTGTGRAYDLSAVDTLPADWTYRAGSASISGPDGTAAVEPVISGSRLTWAGLLPVTGLAPGQNVGITFTTEAGPGANHAEGTAFAHTNTVTATAADATGATASATGPYAAGSGRATARIAAADLSLTKSAGEFVAGGTGTWSLVVGNAGPDTATGPFVVTDRVPSALTLPDGGDGAALTVIGAAGTGWSCTVGSGLVTCTRTDGADTLARGATFPPIVLTVSIPADAVTGSSADNEAAVTGRTHDPVTADNTDSATGTVRTAADLAAVKTGVGSMVAGRNASWELRVVNNGPSLSRGPITLTDTLPLGTTFVSATGTGWTCPAAPEAGAITCTWSADLAAAGPAATTGPLQITVAVPSSRTATVINTATVAGITADPVPGNDTATVSTTPQQLADLAAAKVLADKDTSPVVAGTDREYRITVTNSGPSDARDVVVVDTLPVGITWTGAWTDTDWTCAAGPGARDVRCSLDGPLAAGAQNLLTLDVAIPGDHDVTQPLVNRAEVSASTPDPLPANNIATDNSSVVGVADLSIAKTVSVPAVAGRPAAYELMVGNAGPSSATGPTVVQDVLPDGLTFDPAAPPSGPGWTCEVAPGNTVTCSLPATIGAADSAPVITVPVLVDEATRGPVDNRATVTGPLTDPNPVDNSVVRPTPIEELARVTVTKAAVEPVVTAGTLATWTVTVENEGPSTARGLVLTDLPVAGLLLQSVAGDGWTCVADRCTRDELPVGSSTVTVTTLVDRSVPAGAVLDNVARLTVQTPSGPDAPPAESTASVEVDTRAGVTLTKTHDGAADPVVAGTTATFRLTAANAGPSDAVGPVTVTDTLPAGMTFVSAAGPWTCVDGTPLVCTFTGGRLPAGGSAPALQLVVAVGADVPDGVLVNTAVVGTGTPQDPAVDPNAADALPITTRADLSIRKTHTGVALAGTEFEWSLAVGNLGPSRSVATADDPIVVRDTLPTGTVFVSGGDADWSCSAVGQEVTCLRSTDLAVASTATFPLRVSVDKALLTGFDNTATVQPGATPEPSGEAAIRNNSSTDAVPLRTEADLDIAKTHPDGARATAGLPFTWTVTVTNAGPSQSWADEANPLAFTDTLPTGVSFTGSVSDVFGCAAGDGAEVVCSRTAPLDPGTYTVELTGTVSPDALGDPVDPDGRSLTNRVLVTAVTTPDPTVPVAAEDTVPLDFSADVSIVKSHTEVPVPGEDLTWTLQVANAGPSVSRGPITVTDTLPTGVLPVAAAGTGWDCAVSGQDLTCTLGTVADPADLPVGAAAPISLTAAVDPSQVEAFSNTAVVRPGATPDPVPDNNSSTDGDLLPQPSSALTISKSHDPALVRIGDELTWTVQVANDGPSTATDVVVVDTLPAGLLPISGTGIDFDCTTVEQQISCAFTAEAGMLPLADGGAVHLVEFTALVTAAAYPAVDNVVEVRAATQAPDADPVTAVDETVVPPQVDLAVTKTAAGPFVVGDLADYRITVRNAGPTPDPGPVTVTDTLPAGLTAVSATPGPGTGSCTIGGSVVCVLDGPLAVGAEAVVDLVVQVGPAAHPAVVNTATVATPSQDLEPSNDRSTVRTPVTPVIGTTLVKTVLAGPGPDQLSWTLAVGNVGPSPATGRLVLTDVLPTGLTVSAVTPAPGWECTFTPSTVTCEFVGGFAVGRTDQLVVVTDVATDFVGGLVNQAVLQVQDAVEVRAAAGWTVRPPEVGPPTTPPGPPTAPPGTDPPPTGPQLPSTGFSAAVPLQWALLLVLAGWALSLGGRRRRSDTTG